MFLRKALDVRFLRTLVWTGLKSWSCQAPAPLCSWYADKLSACYSFRWLHVVLRMQCGTAWPNGECSVFSWWNEMLWGQLHMWGSWRWPAPGDRHWSCHKVSPSHRTIGLEAGPRCTLFSDIQKMHHFREGAQADTPTLPENEGQFLHQDSVQMQH